RTYDCQRHLSGKSSDAAEQLRQWNMNRAFQMLLTHDALVCESRGLWSAAETDKVVQIEGVKPGLDIFPGLTVLAHVFSKAGQSFGVGIRSTVIEICGPRLDFPWRARDLSVC